MLKSIILKNWRSHKETQIEFGSGTNIIVGRMGGGKSSIIDAICFALFGTCPAVQHRRLKIADYIRSRPDEQKEAEVVLAYQLNDDTYEVRRKVRQAGSSEAELKKNGKLIEGPQAQRVTEYIEHLLELDYDLFTRAVYSEQNRIDYFLTLPKGERKRQIDELLGLTRFEEVRKNSITVSSRLRDIISDRQLLLKSFQPEQLQNEITSIESELSALKTDIINVTKKCEEISSKKSTVKQKFDKLTKIRDIYKKLFEKKTGLEHTISLLRKELADSKFEESEFYKLKEQVESIKEKRDALQQQYIRVDQKFNAVLRKNAELEKTLDDINERIRKRDALLSSLKILLKGMTLEALHDESENIELEIKKITEEIASKKATLRDIEKAIVELSREISRCPVCDSELKPERRTALSEEKKKQQLEISNSISLLEKEMHQINSKSKELKDTIKKAEEYSARLEDFEGLEERKRECESIKEGLTNELATIKNERESLSKERESITDEFTELSKHLERMNEILLRKRKLEELTATLDVIDKELRELKFDENEWNATDEELKKISIEEIEVLNAKKMLEQNIRHLEEKLSDRKKTVEDIKHYKEEVEFYTAEMEKLQIFANVLVETQHAMREELIAAVNEALLEVWKVIYPYADYPMLQIKPSEDDYDLSFGLPNGGGEEWISVDGIASGGERALACLALRTAFAMVLTPNLSWLILDEPTHNLDEDAVRTLAVALHDHIPKIVNQIFVITHDENLRDAASGKLIRVERSKEVPEVSVAEVVS